nr:immunoglobulin light chain junction region [Mus musculus]
CAQNLELPFTF